MKYTPSKDILMFNKASQHRFINTLKPMQNGYQCAGDIFKGIHFVKLKFSYIDYIFLGFILKSLMDKDSALVKMMTYYRSGDKPLSEPVMV